MSLAHEHRGEEPENGQRGSKSVTAAPWKSPMMAWCTVFDDYFRVAEEPPSDGSIPGLVSDIPIYRQLSVKTTNAEPSGRVPGFVFRQKNDAA
jgi:hypothetical protein